MMVTLGTDAHRRSQTVVAVEEVGAEVHAASCVTSFTVRLDRRVD